jgi:hypothetical protein
MQWIYADVPPMNLQKMRIKMRYEYVCTCEATIAVEQDTTDYNEIDILQNRYELLVATHIANCRKALVNYPLKEVITNE